MKKINLQQKLGLFDETWTPKIIGALNGQEVKIAKLDGDFVWHAHEDEDELFLVLEGSLVMKFADRDVKLEVGEMLIVPRGVEHMPVAAPGTSVLLFEPESTAHTGKVVSERTVNDQKWI
ncbi:MAG: cupin domain-containing protein [Planctomycetes bacterium]|nr:cupin domain-containing protein [Planctomycetota bacterium]MCP4769945.1 cupin domain-containing protein [Planctomycetota bacterium]MCP4859785.1 cupin domain-containing protein [Planctomycetota bacterium]